MALQLQGAAAAVGCRCGCSVARQSRLAVVGTGFMLRASVVRRSMLDGVHRLESDSHRAIADNSDLR